MTVLRNMKNTSTYRYLLESLSLNFPPEKKFLISISEYHHGHAWSKERKAGFSLVLTKQESYMYNSHVIGVT